MLVDDATLLALPGVSAVTRDDGRLRLSVTDTQAAPGGAARRCCASAGWWSRTCARTGPTLEDVFVTLTGKHLRDG